MRANDIELLRNHHVPPRVIWVLRSMYEEQQAMGQQIKELAALFERMCGILGQNTAVMELIKSKMPHVQALKEQGMSVGSDPSLTGEIGEDDGR